MMWTYNFSHCIHDNHSTGPKVSFWKNFISLRSLPADYCLQPLKPSDIRLVASKWKLLPLNDAPLFMKCLEIGKSVGAYKRMKNGEQELVCWAMPYHRGSITHLYCLEEYRCKGLTLVIMYELCKGLKAKGYNPAAEIDEAISVHINCAKSWDSRRIKNSWDTCATSSDYEDTHD